MKFKVLKGRLHKLIDFLFSDVPDEKKSAKRRTPKVPSRAGKQIKRL